MRTQVVSHTVRKYLVYFSSAESTLKSRTSNARLNLVQDLRKEYPSKYFELGMVATYWVSGDVF